MEFVEGKTLRQLLRASEGTGDGASGPGLDLPSPRGASVISQDTSAETWTEDGTVWSSSEDNHARSAARESSAGEPSGNGAPDTRPEPLDFRRIVEAFAGVAD